MTQKPLGVFFIVLLLGMAVFYNSLNNKFLMDDKEFVSNPYLSSIKYIKYQWNPYGAIMAGGLDQQGLRAYYRPLTHITYDICYDVFKKDYWKYHLLNILLFVVSAFLSYLLITKISGNEALGALAGIFYLVHPINGIVVNYISASVFAFQMICMLATILLLWEALEKKNNRGLYVLSLFFSVLSLLWHESGIMTPFYAAAVVFLFRKDSLKQKLIYLFPYFLVAFCFLIFRTVFVNFHEQILFKLLRYHLSWYEYPSNLFQVFRWYVLQLFYPKSIVLEWAAPIFHHHAILNDLGLLSLLIFLIALYAWFAKEKIGRLAVIWILIGAAPVCFSAFHLPDAGVVIEPHWFIFASLGFFIIIALYCLMLWRRMKAAGAILVVFLIVGWGAVSHAYNFIWSDQVMYNRFWISKDATLDAPYLYLAESYQEQGNFELAGKYYRMADSLVSNNLLLNSNVWSMQALKGDWKGAELNYRNALSIYAKSSISYNNLGYIYFKDGNLNRATEYFLLSIIYDPLFPEPRRNLARIYIREEKYSQAITQCLANLNLIPDDQPTLEILIQIAVIQNDRVHLTDYARRLIAADTDAQDLISIGRYMAEHQSSELAVACFTKALQLAPNDKNIYLAAGSLFENLGQYTQALHLWQLGAGIDPTDQRFSRKIADLVRENKKE